jgi:hypothetical protein
VSGDSFTSTLRAGDYIFIFNGFNQIASITDGDHLVLTSSLGVRTNLTWYIQPGSVTGAALVFDPATKTILLYGGTTQSTSIVYNETWAYDTQGMKWARKGVLGTPPPTESAAIGYVQPAFACVPAGGTCYYHQTTGVNSPQDFVYNTATDTLMARRWLTCRPAIAW